VATVRPWPRGPRQRLPRTIAPFRWEAVSSYIDRLARANHIGVSTLRGHVAESCAARPRPDWLAVVSGQPEQVIRSRLCGLAGDPTALKQYLRRPLCQRFMARKGIHEPVYCYLPAHVSVCHPHRRWIGSPTRVLDDQVDLRDRPTVLSAGRTHRRLARQYSEVDLHDALGDARHILVFWAHAERHVAAGILQNGLEAHVVAYPDVIAVAATLLTARPRVEQPRTPTEPAWPTLLLDRINERTGAHHADATPVEQWAQYRRLFATAVLTTRSDGAELACRA
jgi:hypothetical protein